MPLGSQEGDTRPQAVELLKTHGRGRQVDLRQVALLMDDVVERYDSDAARDVVALLASRLVEHAGLSTHEG